ncbi:MAG: hypothetical protein CVV22_04130 [Ignavibacteriae bacterium HGW-Ignavibacteriae-1]|jgi:hypothetical protein|nr:MAG: hypothetical protein CVV22_04130 [Ignavibacteriae bacterium HGW-Ignavibacteriae-1]
MKKFHILIFGVIFLMATSLTQALPEIFYTNFARTTGGGLVLNSNVDVRVTIFDGATEVYKETHAGITTDEFGLFTVPVGGGTPVAPFNSAMYDALIASNNLNIYAESDAGDGYRFIELRSLLSTALKNAEIQGMVNLQSAYDAGNDIEVVVGFPVDLTGTGLIQSAASIADINANGDATLTTKEYVDDAIAAIFPLPQITEGDAIEILPDGYYDGTATQSIGVADNTITNAKINDNAEFAEVSSLGDGYAEGTDVGSWSVTNSNRVLNFAGVGLTNVTRDGNTVLIDGSDNWGMQVVESDATLLGDGTVGNELGVDETYPFVWTAYHQFIPSSDEPAISIDGTNSTTNPSLIAVGNADPTVPDFMLEGEMVLLGTDDTDVNAELTVYGSTQLLGQKNDGQHELYVEGDVEITGHVDAERGFFTFDNTGVGIATALFASATGDTPSNPSFPTVAQAVTGVATYSGAAPNMTDMLSANVGIAEAGAGILAIGTYGGSRSDNLVANVGAVGHAYNSLSPYNSHGTVGMVTATAAGATEIGTALGLGINSGITGINLGVAANDYAGYFIGNVNVDGDLNSTGNAVFENDVQIDGNLNVDGTITGHELLLTSGNFRVAEDVNDIPWVNINKASGTVMEIGLGTDGASAPAGYGLQINNDAGDMRAGIGLHEGNWVVGVTDGVNQAGAISGPSATMLTVLNAGTPMFVADQDGNTYVAGDLDVDGTITGTTLNGAYTEGSVLFGAADGSITENNGEIFWDDAASYLGLGTTTPGAKLHLVESTGTALFVEGVQGDATPDVMIDGEVWILGNVDTEPELYLNGGDGILLDGGADIVVADGGTLDVDGDGTFNNDLYVTDDLFVGDSASFGSDVMIVNDLTVGGLSTFENVMVNEFAESAKTGAEIAAEVSDNLFVTKDYVQGGHFGTFNTLIAFNPASGPAITATSSDATAPTVTIENTHPDGTALQVQSNNASTTAFEIPTGNMSIGNGQLIISANAGITSAPPEGQGPALIVGNFGTSGENGGGLMVIEGHTALSFNSYDETTTDYSDVAYSVIDINAGAAMAITALPGADVSADMPATLLYIINSGTFTITLPGTLGTILAGEVATFVHNGSAWYRIN